jgi:hydrogenase/urease accessory protein HupE
MRRRSLACVGLVVLLLSAFARAHEVRPAYLQITELPDHGYEVLWKRPLMGEVAVHLAPHLSGGWLDGPPAALETTASFAIEAWRIAPGEHRTLNGQIVWIEGLENTITDALVIVRRNDGTELQTVLTPSEPKWTLQGSQEGVWAYFGLGVMHILTGIDHLLFVLGLLLLVPERRMLVKTITAFTAAHSITLAVATLGLARIPVSYIDTLIALSILFLGTEVVRHQREGTSFTIRHPWVAAFGFGLLHGFGFASGLTAVGLPQHAVAMALLLFNAGIELGQLSFVIALIVLGHICRALRVAYPRAAAVIPAYFVGTLGAFWTLERIVLLLQGSGP